MDAYRFAMVIILINAGIFIIASCNVFGDDITEGSTILGWFSSQENSPESSIFAPSIGGIAIGGTIVALTIAMFWGSVRVIGSSPPSPEGWAYVAFTIVFWLSFASAYDILYTIAKRVPGLSVFNAVFTVVAILIFVMALIQFSTSGVKSHG